MYTPVFELNRVGGHCEIISYNMRDQRHEYNRCSIYMVEAGVGTNVYASSEYQFSSPHMLMNYYRDTINDLLARSLNSD